MEKIPFWRERLAIVADFSIGLTVLVGEVRGQTFPERVGKKNRGESIVEFIHAISGISPFFSTRF